MPYIKKEDRRKFDKVILNNLSKLVETDGELNYCVSLLLHSILEKRGINYQNMNNLIGTLECVKLELYRKVVSPYEEAKIDENGTVSRLDEEKSNKDEITSDVLYQKGVEIFVTYENFVEWMSYEARELGYVSPFSISNTPEGRQKIYNELLKLEFGATC